MIKAQNLSELETVSHGFFTREGGYSSGIYASLNTGLGADEDNEVILKNRDVVKAKLGARELVTPYQYHSAQVLNVEKPWSWQNPPKADGLVTAKSGIAIAVNTADCTPVIFADETSRVVGVAHSGWKGTVGGVLENTIAAMEKLGSKLQNIVVAIGPTISQVNYEVGPEFVEQFLKDNPESEKFFVPSKQEGHQMFDLPGCVEDRLLQLNLKHVENLVQSQGLCTYGNENRFFSYRRMTHRGEADYGRQMSGVCLR